VQCTLGWRVVRVILCIVSADVSFDSPLIYVRVDLSLGGQKRSPLILALQSRGQCAAAGARVMSITRQPAKFLVFTHRISSAMYIKVVVRLFSTMLVLMFLWIVCHTC
jgi:hypothetical protein